MTASSAPSFLSPTAPTVAIEIAPRRITAVAIGRKGARATILAHASERLPAGLINPALTATNIPDRAPVVDVLKRVVQQLGGRPKRVGLVIPDSLAKVSFVRFEKVPSRPEDLDQLVRWQIRKTAPFKIEDAQVSSTPGAAQDGGGREFIVTLARRDIVDEYESVCAAAGLHAGIVDLATFNLINVVIAANGAGAPTAAPAAANASIDWLVVHVTPEYSTIAILRGGDLVFFRNLRDEGESNLADFVHQTAMYYEDRLSGAGFARTFLTGAASVGDAAAAPESEIRHALERRLNTAVEPIDLRTVAELRDQIAPARELLDSLASPVGLLIRDAA